MSVGEAGSESVTALESVTDLVEIAGKLKASRVVIAGGHRVDDLRLVESARDHGIIGRTILVGRKALVDDAVAQVGIDLDSIEIIPAEDDEAMAAATVSVVRDGRADMVLKGGISTPVINRRMLKLAVRPTVSLASVFEASPIAGSRPMIMTDPGVTTVCNFGRMVGLIDNAIEVARVAMGIECPKVAVLSANEKQIASMPSTGLARRLSERSWPNATVYGPLSLDLAIDPESVVAKSLPDTPAAAEVAGNADILACPSIETANVLYKLVMAMSKYGQASIACITLGFPVPYIILSRADTLETRLFSIALCSIYAQRTATAAMQRGAKPGAAAQEPAATVLAVNPGSTSIKVTVHAGGKAVQEEELPYEMPSLATAGVFEEQVGKLTGLVRDRIREWGIEGLRAIAARGGFLPRPASKLSSGTYVVAETTDRGIVVNREIVEAITERAEKEHAGNLGIPVAARLAVDFGVPAFAVDPVVVDEFCPEAEVSGYRGIARRSTAHALSIHAAARRAAEVVGRNLADINLVVAHLGGGITVAAVRQGRMTDNNIALLGGGPFTPQRAGALPTDGLIDLCYSGGFTRDELVRELTKRGGLQSYLGEHRMEAIEDRIAGGDREAELVVNAMIYQVAKEIGAMYVAAGTDVEAVVLTGGLVRSRRIRKGVSRAVAQLAPVLVFPGSLEMQALAEGVIEVLEGRRKPLRYRAG